MFETLTHVAQISDSLAVSRSNRGSFILGSLRRFRRRLSMRHGSTSSKHDEKARSKSQSNGLESTGTFQHNSVGHRSRSPFIQRRDRTDAIGKLKTSSVEVIHEPKRLEASPKVTNPASLNCKKGWLGEESEVCLQ